MSSKMVEFTVNGKKLLAFEGLNLLKYLLDNGYNIPHYCYHDSLGADGNCRMCMVEIKGKKRPQIACDTLIKEGLEVNTNTPTIKRLREEILQMQLRNHPVDCPVCDKAGECYLQNYYMDYGLYKEGKHKKQKIKKSKNIEFGRNVVYDEERCILCKRCVRFFANITKTNELGVIKRANHSTISTAPNQKLQSQYAMNIVDLCPVGALLSSDFKFKQRVWFLQSSPSICHGCTKNCNITIDYSSTKFQAERIYRYKARRNEDVNGYFICDEGRLSYKEYHTNRVTQIEYKNSIIDFKEAISKIGIEIFIHKDIVILASPNLYIEELESIIKWSKKLNARLYSPLECYKDKEFADNWLKEELRVANAYGVMALEIDTSTPDISSDTLLINFDHKLAQDINTLHRIDFITHSINSQGLILPLASWVQSSRHLINSSGIKQYAPKTLVANKPILTVTEWIEAIGGDI